MRKFPQLLGTLRKFPRWLGQQAAYFTSEEISTLVGILIKFPRLGHLAAYIISAEISTVAGNIEEISSMGGAVYCIYYK